MKETLASIVESLQHGEPLDRPTDFRDLARAAIDRKQVTDLLIREGKFDFRAWASALAESVCDLTD